MTQPPDPSSQPSDASTSSGKIASPERKWAQGTATALIRWMPLGGSGAALISSVFQQDLVLAVLMFPTTIVTGVWAAYSQNLLEQLQAIYAERGKEDANKLVAWLDSLNEALKWQFSGFEAKYLKLQAKLCQEYTTEGFTPDRTMIPMLEEVFVPLQLSGYIAEGARDRQFEKQPTDGLSIWDLLRRSRKDPTFRQIAIQAQGGFGKTTLLRHVALIYGQGKLNRYRAPKLIPFLLYLRDWRDLLSQDQIPSLAELITHHYLLKLTQNNPLKLPYGWVDATLWKGKALVMLDGFDELAEDQRKRVSHWISRQMNDYDRTTFILTSRPTGFKDYVAKRPTAPLFVQKFNSDQQERFVKRWYLYQERYARSEQHAAQAREVAERNAQQLLSQLQDPNRPELREMAENPLLLNMLTTFHRFDPRVELPKRRIELYRGICKLQLEDRPNARGIPMLLSLEKSQKILQFLAFSMVKLNRTQLSRQEIINFLKKNLLLKREEIVPEIFLKQMVQVSELWVEREPGMYEFPHLSFQGYFAASYLAQQPEATALTEIRANWEKAWWRETILLYTAQLSPRLMTYALREACTLGRESAQLAYDCLREYRNPERLDPRLEEELATVMGTVKELLYAQLEEYLKNGEWKKADYETYRLMITNPTVGKEEGQWFDRSDFKNFPHEDLRTIDQLWFKYSNGKWGFSVQKRIWQECGSPMEYNDDLKKFGDRVGWRKAGNWLTTEELTYNLQKSLFGELPCHWFGYWVGRVVWGIGEFTLLSREDL